MGELTVHHCVFSLLITPVLGSLESEWLWCLVAILAC